MSRRCGGRGPFGSKQGINGPGQTFPRLSLPYNKVIFGPVSPFVTSLCSRNNRKIKEKERESRQRRVSFVSESSVSHGGYINARKGYEEIE